MQKGSAYYVPLLRGAPDTVRAAVTARADERGHTTKADRIVLDVLDAAEPPSTVELAARHECKQPYVSRVLADMARAVALPTVADRRSTRQKAH